LENQPIIPRDNPLARKLASIARINEEYGTRASGGGGAPIVPVEVPPAAGSTVLPPEPTPLTPEQEAELQEEFDRQWGKGPHPTEEPRPVAAVGASRVPSYPAPPGPSLGRLPEGFAAIDLVHGQIVATNGLVFPITPAEQKKMLQFCLRAFRRAMEEQLEVLTKAITQAVPAKEQPGGGATSQEVVPAVPAGETPRGVDQESGEGGRSELVVPGVPGSDLQPPTDGDGEGRAPAL
jgi:hypothetical protein